jgi:ribose transport system substrate-binding protein
LRQLLRPQFAALSIFIGCLALAGCGGGSGSGSSGATGSESEAGSSNIKYAQQATEEGLGPKGSFKKAPTKTVKPQSGKKLMVVSCGQTITACRFANGAVQRAAGELGWETTLYDTKGDYAASSTAIRNAVAGGYDGITMYFIDCSFAQAALQEAKEADIPVVTAEGFDCDEVNSGAPSLFTYQLEYALGDYEEYAKAWGRINADYAIANQNGESNALIFADDTAQANIPISEGEMEEYEKCDSCSAEIVKFPISDFGTALQRVAEQELLKHQDVNTVLTTYEAISLEVYPAVQASGREILVFMGEGGKPGLDLIREGANVYSSGFPLEWEGYGLVDALARIFNGEKPIATGIGLQLIDAEHSLPKSGPYKSPIDFEAMYRKLWGLE